MLVSSIFSKLFPIEMYLQHWDILVLILEIKIYFIRFFRTV